MAGKKNLLIGAAVGALAMYFFDPVRGRTRRIHVRDKAIRAVNKGIDNSIRYKEDMRNRIYGATEEIKARMERRPVDDHTLELRVRSAFGRVVSHAKAIRVTVDKGNVYLTGPILTREVIPLINCVRKVRGVVSVHEQLDKHTSPEKISALQGRGPEYLI